MCETTCGKEPVPQLAPDGPQRDARGRWVRQNAGALQHGVHSEQRALSLHAARIELRTAILGDLGTTEADIPRALSMAVDRLIEAHLIASSYFEFLATSGGPITTKGRQRRAVDGWNKASAVVAKFAAMVGLERRPRNVETPHEWLERISDRGDSTEPPESADV